MKRPLQPAGFTLIEVIIAMFVIALGVGALLSALTSSADSMGRLRDKSFAEWIALNRISEVRLATTRPRIGVTNGETEFASAKWRWRQTVADQGMAGMLRIDVAVAHGDAGPSDSTPRSTAPVATGDSFPAVATAYGFVGTAVALSNPLDPDWSLGAIAGGGGNGGGAGGSPPTP